MTLKFLNSSYVGFDGLGVTSSHRNSRFAGSDPTEAIKDSQDTRSMSF